MEDEDDDFELVPTQVAAQSQSQSQGATQISAVQVAAAPSSSSSHHVAPDIGRRARELCAVCTLDMTAWSIMDRAVHMNACLDATTLRVQFDCPACAKDLTDYNEQRRAAHVNICLDRMAGAGSEWASQSPATATAATDGSASSAVDAASSSEVRAGDASAGEDGGDSYSCKICGQDLSGKSIDFRIRHVKQCGQRFGVRPSDLATLSSTAADQAPIHLLTDDQQQQFTRVEAESEAAFASVGGVGQGRQRNAFDIMMTRASSASTAVQLRGSADGSNAFDVMMKSSRTVTVIGASKRQRGGQGGWRAGGNNNRNNNNNNNGSGRRRAPSCPEFKRVKGTLPPFIVDGFPFASKELSSIYFLTHFHSDHYGGITKSFDCGVIYCNEVTGRLVVQELGVASKFVHPVPMDRPVIVEGVEVTFMDANHCPGAAILLFRLKNGRVYLHTGDFRFNRFMLAYPPLRPFVPTSADDSTASAGVRLDGVYLDTTYANPKYTFPTQQAVIDHALSLMDRHLQRQGGDQPPEPDRKTLFLFGSYSLGKERLFMEVAAKFHRKVCVSKAKMRVISTFGWPERQLRLLTTEAGATNLHVVPMQDLQMEHLTALLDKHRLRFHRIVAFRPTGWTFGGGGGMSTCKTDPSGRIRIYGVPYSEHSSFLELVECVRALNPREIIPTVNCSSEQQVRRQVDALKQAAFRNLTSLFQSQQKQQQEAPAT